MEAVEAQHGIVVKEDPGEYKFSHLTFQEFYTARYMIDNSDETLVGKALEKHMGEPRWNEVLLIAGGLQKDGSRYVYELKTRLDRLRNNHVEAVLEMARDNVKDPDAFDHTVNVILALTQLLKDATQGVQARGLQATADFAALTARRVCELSKVDASPDAAMLRVTQLGLARHRVSLQSSVKALTRYEDSWHSLQRYFIGMHILMGCLAGEATLPASYRDTVLKSLFSPGCPEPPKITGELLFSA